MSDDARTRLDITPPQRKAGVSGVSATLAAISALFFFLPLIWRVIDLGFAPGFDFGRMSPLMAIGEILGLIAVICGLIAVFRKHSDRNRAIVGTVVGGVVVAFPYLFLLLLTLVSPLTRHTKEDQQLIAASAQGDKDMVLLMLASKADVNAKGDNGQTALHEAVISGHKDVAQALLANGADVNAKDRQGRTPLRIATTNGNNDVAELLRQAGGHE